MRPNSRALQLVAAACSTALLLAACGGDEEADEAPSSTEAVSVAESETTETTEGAAEDEAVAEDEATEGAGSEASENDSPAATGPADAAVDEAVGAELDDVFAGYRQALVDRDGEAAVVYVSPSTIEWYGGLLDLGIRADADVLEAEAPLADAMSVVPLRAWFGDELTTFADGRELFVRGVDAGLTGDDLASIEIDSFTSEVEGSATGVVRGQPLFVFARADDGSWALDLEATTTAIFTQLPEDEFVNGLTGGQGTSRRDLFELVARNVYATTWDELSQPIEP